MSNTNPHETYLRKGPNGWRASSAVTLPDGRYIEVCTRKHQTLIVTNVTGGKSERGFFHHVIYEDFFRTYFAAPGRCTEKAVSEQHAAALAKLEAIAADVAAHYAAKGGDA